MDMTETFELSIAGFEAGIKHILNEGYRSQDLTVPSRIDLMIRGFLVEAAKAEAVREVNNKLARKW